MRQLKILWDGRKVGSYVCLDDGTEMFSYDAEYLASINARAISHSLPLRRDPYGQRQLRPFFAGLLPEDAQRQRIATYLGIDEADDFSLLAAIGGECAGALSIVAEDTKAKEQSAKIRLCDVEELKDIIKSLPYRPLLVGEKGLRLSLAGAQAKLPVIFKDGQFYLPENGAPSTHIIKPELSQWFKGIVKNEHTAMTLAKAIGLNVAKTEMLAIGGIPCLLVERYDRMIDIDSGKIKRIHQEDFCQALGRTPHQKYQSDGGPLAREIVRLLRDGWSTSPARDVLAFVDLMIYNSIIGNADAHGKNYSMLYKGSERRLAPGYDLVSTVYWPQLAVSPAMKIGAADSINSLQSGHWRKFAQELNISPSALAHRIKAQTHVIENSTCKSLALDPECDDVLALIKSRAETIEANL